jgi:hypothetical protein
MTRDHAKTGREADEMDRERELDPLADEIMERERDLRDER